MSECIVIANTKGGVGKTTTAIYLGCALVELGRRVVVVDLDKQGSASSWADRAADAGAPLPFTVEVSNAARLGRLVRSLRAAGVTVVVDTPPGDADAIDGAVSVADFVVVPMQASAIEVERVWATLPAVEGVRHGVLVTAARPGVRNVRQVVDALTAEDVGVFGVVIPMRERIRDAFGSVPVVLDGHDVVAREIVGALS